MPLLETLGLISTIGGGLKSLFQKKADPQAENRAAMEKLMAQIKAEFPKLAESMKTRAAVQAGGLTRRLTDAGAAAGLPSNVTQQNVAAGNLGVQRNLNESLGRLDAQKLASMQDMVKLRGAIPPKPVDTSGEDLLSTGLQLLTTAKEGSFDFSGILSGLFGGGKNQQMANYMPKYDYFENVKPEKGFETL